MIGGFTGFDAILIGIILISGLLGMMLGVTMEILTIMAFGLAVLIALVALPFLRPLTADYLPAGVLQDGTLILVVFFLALIPIWILFYRLARGIAESGLGPLDKSFGFLFGVARAFLIFGLLFLVATQFVWTDKRPDWLTQGRMTPIIEATADILGDLFLGDIVNGPADDQEKGYTPEQIRDKENLIERSSN